MKRAFLALFFLVAGVTLIVIPLNVSGLHEAVGAALIVSGIIVLVTGIVLLSYNKKGEQSILGSIFEFLVNLFG